MIMMNSVLTAEERYVLQSLGCKDKTQAVGFLQEGRFMNWKMLMQDISYSFGTVHAGCVPF